MRRAASLVVAALVTLSAVLGAATPARAAGPSEALLAKRPVPYWTAVEMDEA